MGCILFTLSAVYFVSGIFFRIVMVHLHLLFKAVYLGYSTNTNTLVLSIPGASRLYCLLLLYIVNLDSCT
jgi:hypothetical protein